MNRDEIFTLILIKECQNVVALVLDVIILNINFSNVEISGKPDEVADGAKNENCNKSEEDSLNRSEGGE